MYQIKPKMTSRTRDGAHDDEPLVVDRDAEREYGDDAENGRRMRADRTKTRERFGGGERQRDKNQHGEGQWTREEDGEDDRRRARCPSRSRARRCSPALAHRAPASGI